MEENYEKAPETEFDSLLFDDPVATDTEWEPINQDGKPSFRTHRFTGVFPNKLEYRLTLSFAITMLFFLLLGVALAGMAFLLFIRDAKIEIGRIVLGAIGLFISFGCLVTTLSLSTPIVFDKDRGFFWKGKTAPDECIDSSRMRDCCRLEDVYAIQILTNDKGLGSVSDRHTSYELNLVTRDAQRVNVIYGDQESMRQDAKVLSLFLNVPVWDATDF